MRRGVLHPLLILVLTLSTALAATARADDGWVKVTSPVPGSEVVSKRPDIKAEFTAQVKEGSLMVTLDGVDVTKMGDVTSGGFTYTPLMALPAGQHVLTFTAEDAGGNRLVSQAAFTSRQTGAFEEAYSSNDVSVIYTAALGKSKSLASAPYWKVEGNIASNSKLKEGGFDASFTTNVRYLEQGSPLYPPANSQPNTYPISKGFNVANWLFQCNYKRDKLSVHASLGDVVVTETPYTVNGLARRGGILGLGYGIFSAEVFSIRGDQVYGFNGGTGIDPEPDRHISGVSADVKLPGGKAELKAVYAAGGEQASSYGTTTTSGPKKGDVAGAQLLTDMLGGKLKTDFEVDYSRFDPDTTDDISKRSDYAYRLRAGGYVDTYSYDLAYEYFGQDYTSIGNLALERDKRKVTATGGGVFGVHSVNALFSWSQNNVEDDPLSDTVRNYLGTLNYAFLKYPTLPMGFTYTKTVQDMGKHPPGTVLKELETDTVSGWINYTWNRLNLGLMSSYSELNDRTAAATDNTAINCTLTSSYNAPGFSVSPSFIMNRTRIHLTNVWTDVYTINLDTRTSFLDDRAAFDAGGSYVITTASDSSVDNLNLNVHARLSYALKEVENLLRGYVKPAVAITGTYVNFNDRLPTDADKDEYSIFLELTASFPFTI
jgi:hypothetical protein